MTMEEDWCIHAPPPTPIATGKGTTFSAVNDEDLSNYLEKSLKIPELSLPKPFPCPLKPLLRRVPVGIDLESLQSGDYASVRNLLDAAVDSGVFTINGHGLTQEELRAVVDFVACGKCGKYGEMDSCIVMEMGGVTKEFLCSGPVCGGQSPERTQTYLVLRKKLESIAETVIQVIVENTKSASNPKIMRRRIKEGYIVFLRKHVHLRHLENHGSNFPVHIDKYKKTDEYHSLSLHMSTLELRHEFRVRCKDGCATSFRAPVGSLIVAIGRQLEEWSDGEVKGVIGEVVLDSRHDPIPNPSFSLEFMFTTPGDALCTKHRAAAGVQPIMPVLSLVDRVLIGVGVGLLAFLLASYFSR